MRYTCTLIFSILILITFQTKIYSQVGIGNTDPHPSSILDVRSDTQGMLTPRMNTSQRLLIASPADGLIVFDTDKNSFYFFNDTEWIELDRRNNYKLVKNISDLGDELAAGGSTEYLLDENILYEINGLITLAVPINLNGAYIVGRDTNEDILLHAGGTIFTGAAGGSIKGLTLSAPGGTVFNLSGSGVESIIFRDCIVANSGGVGSISNYKTVFLSIVQYGNNANGIIYTDIEQLLLNTQGWDSSNGGIYETFVGDFDVITKQGGFSKVIAATAAIDVTGITSISGGAGMRIVDFYGGGNYINGSSPYVGYNFTNDWDINSPGILVETDNNATGDINLNAAVGSGAVTSFVGNGIPSRTKILGNTNSNNLFRFAIAGNNRLVYDGQQTRYFNFSSSLSFQGNNNNAIFIFYFAKNGIVVDQTRVYREVGTNNDVGAVSIVGSIQLSIGDYVEVWAERFSGAGNLLTVSLNLTAK